VNVGYKGCAPALADVVGGQVPIAILSANLVPAYVQSGKLKVIGVTSVKRYANLPDSPTIAEQGVKGFDYDAWYALMGPGKMSPQLTQKIATDVSRVLDDPAVRKIMVDAGIEIKKGSGRELSKVIASDSQRYLELAKKFDIKPE
jgi:tripartite-type tricarboxylate transporter receptor subunit TctC